MENPNRLGSQIQGSPCSLSLPSEPPDVRNLFSSFEYDSPVLGTIDGFKDSVTRENQGLVIQESNKEKINHLCEFNITSEIMDSLCLPSQVSEPADVGNWFSSYAYESFVLDTNDDVQDSVSHESDCDKERSLVGDSQKEQENMAAFREIKNCKSDKLDEKCSTKILNSPDSPTVFTEPPDVKNWFSSYAYTSPVLGTSDHFEDSLQLEREPEKFVVEDSDGEKEDKFIIIRKISSRDEKLDEEKVHLNSFNKNNSSVKVHEDKKDSKSIDWIGGKEIPSSQINICSVKMFGGSLEGKTLQSNYMSPSKDIREWNFDNEGSISKLEQSLSQEACTVSWKLSRISSSKEKSRTKLFPRTDLIEEFMEDVNPLSPPSNFKLPQVCGASTGKQTHKRNDKENDKKGIADNGFVATRKNGSARTANEDSSKRPQGVLLECSRNKGTVCLASEKDAVDRRKALMETTNFQKSDVFEVTGKWRCPQRGKPNLGPPLKQLRLERWIHRVQN